MLADPHLTVKYYEQDSSKVFANTDIKDGVAITYRDKKKNYGEIGTFTVSSELNSIIKKIKQFPQIEFLNKIVVTRTAGWLGLYSNSG